MCHNFFFSTTQTTQSPPPPPAAAAAAGGGGGATTTISSAAASSSSPLKHHQAAMASLATSVAAGGGGNNTTTTMPMEEANQHPPDALEHIKAFEALTKDRTKQGLRFFALEIPIGTTDIQAQLTQVKFHTTSVIRHLFLVRHGEGEHNVFAAEMRKKYPDRTNWSPYSDPSCPIDPSLTEKGLEEARMLGRNASNIFIPWPKLLVVSPLMRTIETGLTMIGSNKVEKIIANEKCREKSGLNPCDARRSKTKLKARFPQIDFDTGVLHEEDETAYRDRETSAQLVQRGYEFMSWIHTLDEYYSTIMVSTHSAFLLAVCSNVLEPHPDYKGPSLNRWYNTGEVRSYIIEFRTNQVEEEKEETPAKL